MNQRYIQVQDTFIRYLKNVNEQLEKRLQIAETVSAA